MAVSYGPGNWFGLPELGITELLGGNKRSLPNASIRAASRGKSSVYTSPVVTGNNAYNVPWESGTSLASQAMQVSSPTPTGRVLSSSTGTPNEAPSGSPRPSSFSGSTIGAGNSNPQGSVPTQVDSKWFNSQSDAQRYQEEMGRRRGSIENRFGEYASALDKVSGLFPQWEQGDTARLDQTRQSLLGGVDTARQGAEAKLESYRTDVRGRETRGINKIQDNLRNLLKATALQLGAMGAGSSSASQIIAPYAVSKQGSRAMAEVIRGSNDQLAELDRKAMDVKGTYDDEVSQIEQSMAQQRQSIADKYQQYKMSIEQAKLNADQTRMQALNALDESLISNAQNQINQIESEGRQYRYALDQWFRQRAAQLDDYKLQLTQKSNFVPQALAWQELQGLGGMPQTQSETFYNPFFLKKKKRER